MKDKDHKHYKCESCERSFIAAQYLRNHIYTVHEGHKDYKCESCDKSFSQEGSLKMFMVTRNKMFMKNKEIIYAYIAIKQP